MTQVTVATEVDAIRSVAFDLATFRRFAPLLQRCEAYAACSGYRFQGVDFWSGPTSTRKAEFEAPNSKTDRAIRAAQAAPVVTSFRSQLQDGDPELVDELERAYKLVMVESVRNAMQSMFQAMDMFPPAPAPEGVDDDDCAYEDLAAPLPVVAQRLYNDQVRRLTDSSGGLGRLDQRAKTAAFIVDFAEACQVPLPPMPETQREMLQELLARVADETHSNQSGGGSGEPSRVRDAFLHGLGGGAAAERVREEAGSWWAANWPLVAVALGITGIVGMGAATLVAAVAYAKKKHIVTVSGQQGEEIHAAEHGLTAVEHI